MPFDSGEQLRHRDAQTSRDRERGLNREIVFAALDSTHIGPVQSAMVGERLLRETLLSPKLANSVP